MSQLSLAKFAPETKERLPTIDQLQSLIPPDHIPSLFVNEWRQHEWCTQYEAFSNPALAPSASHQDVAKVEQPTSQTPSLQQASIAYEMLMKKKIQNLVEITNKDTVVNALSDVNTTAAARLKQLDVDIKKSQVESKKLKSTIAENETTIKSYQIESSNLKAQTQHMHADMADFYQFLVEFGRSSKPATAFFKNNTPQKFINSRNGAIESRGLTSAGSRSSVSPSDNQPGSAGVYGAPPPMMRPLHPVPKTQTSSQASSQASSPASAPTSGRLSKRANAGKLVSESPAKKNYYKIKKRKEREEKWISEGLAGRYGFPCPPEWNNHYLLPPPELWQAHEALPWLWMYFEGWPANYLIPKDDPNYVNALLPETELLQRYGIPAQQTHDWALAHNQVLVDQMRQEKLGADTPLSLTEKQRRLLMAVRSTGAAHGEAFEAAIAASDQAVKEPPIQECSPQAHNNSRGAVQSFASNYAPATVPVYVSPYPALVSDHEEQRQELKLPKKPIKQFNGNSKEPVMIETEPEASLGSLTVNDSIFQEILADCDAISLQQVGGKGSDRPVSPTLSDFENMLVDVNNIPDFSVFDEPVGNAPEMDADEIAPSTAAQPVDENSSRDDTIEHATGQPSEFSITMSSDGLTLPSGGIIRYPVNVGVSAIDCLMPEVDVLDQPDHGIWGQSVHVLGENVGGLPEVDRFAELNFASALLPQESAQGSGFETGLSTSSEPVHPHANPSCSQRPQDMHNTGSSIDNSPNGTPEKPTMCSTTQSSQYVEGQIYGFPDFDDNIAQAVLAFQNTYAIASTESNTDQHDRFAPDLSADGWTLDSPETRCLDEMTRLGNRGGNIRAVGMRDTARMNRERGNVPNSAWTQYTASIGKDVNDMPWSH